MKVNDYRNTEYCVSRNNIIKEKRGLEEKIIREHPRTRNMYNQINKKNAEYNKLFREVYHNKCVYCGITTDVISSELFEIDHFVCETAFNGDLQSAGEISNLVLSCKKCNRAKSDYMWDSNYSSCFNVDDGSITELFFRDLDYSIKVEERYSRDSIITEFHQRLKFGEEVRRLDFLLMNMYGFLREHEGESMVEKIAECIILLQQKRNNL